jgi:uncharacterized protein (DUF433 family)
MSAEKTYQYLETLPGKLYRQPYIKGLRMRVEIPYSATIEKIQDDATVEPGMTPEEVAADYGIPLEAVLEAIDWCQKHEDVLIADHVREDRLMEAHGMNDPNYKYDPGKYYKPLTTEERNRIYNDEDLPGR